MKMNQRISDIHAKMVSESMIFLVCTVLAVVSVAADEEYLLDIPQGTLKGTKSITILSEKPFYSFDGIRYVKAIDSSNRFKIAEPPEAWSGVYDATEGGSECVYYCMVRKMVVGFDDCLFVNVYTPEPNKDARKAVMVWIHGGFFNMGSSVHDIYGPDFIVEEDVVLVTFNYRLGAFGFLSTEDSAAPGNVGLKDQNAALKWVHENIQYFGGCPHRVTIFGESAGGAAVQYHMMSPMSTGLFSKAIAQSGSPISSWTITYNAKEAAFKLGQTLGIRTTDSAELVKELEKIPSEKIANAAMAVNAAENSMVGHSFAFIPSVEPEVGQEIFLTADPWELIKRGKVADVPFMAGLNLNETLFMRGDLEERADFMDKNFANFIPEDLNVTDADQKKSLADSMRNFYFGGKPLTKDTFHEYAEMTMDILFNYGVQISVTIINSLKSTPTFTYLFTYESPLGFFKDVGLAADEKGVYHADELGYMFFHGILRSKPEAGSSEERVTHLITKLWTNFAKTGNPTSTLDNYVTTNWEPMGNEHNYANLNQDLKMGKNMFKERTDFWVSIYKDIIGDYFDLF